MRAVRFRLIALALASAAIAAAAAYEREHHFKASELLKPAQVKGPHHTVASKVTTTGYWLDFDITTDYGPLEALGRALLHVRLSEIDALVALDDVSKSEVFLKAAGTSVLNVGKGVSAAVKDPGATAKGIGGGLKRAGANLGRKTKRASDQAVDAVKKDDDDGSDKSTSAKAADTGAGVANSMLGVTSASRKWAQKLGVDPYTTNPILKKALADVGRIDAAGGIAAKVAVPIPMVVSGTATVGSLVWSKDPEELLKLNEQQFKELGVSGDVIKQLYLSQGFTLTLHTRLASSLRAANVPGSADYVASAAEADSERQAVFFVESAELLARFHKTTPIAKLLDDSRGLIGKTKAGHAVALLPLDWVSWTKDYEKGLDEFVSRAKAELGATRLEVHMTGTMSPTAKRETTARGVKVVENLPSSFDVQRASATPKS